jgi:hypothetical protein
MKGNNFVKVKDYSTKLTSWINMDKVKFAEIIINSKGDDNFIRLEFEDDRPCMDAEIDARGGLTEFLGIEISDIPDLT